LARTRLSPVDASFLRIESPTAHMHVGWVALLQPDPARPRPTLQALRAHVGERLALAPRARQRLAFPTLGLGEPSWVDDPEFDVAAHVQVAGDPTEPVTPARFASITDAFLSRPLPRSRPLWEVCLVARLTDGRVGLLGKMHHAMVDGIAAVDLALLLFDLDAPSTTTEEWTPDAPPHSATLAAEALRDAATTPLRVARETRWLLARPRERGGAIIGALQQTALAIREDVLPPAQPSTLNVPIGAARTLLGHSVELAAAQRARRPDGVTINDVCLAAIAGALRELALARGERPRALKTMVPVSVRGHVTSDSGGNRISMAFISLPLDLPTAAERRAHVHTQTRRFKETGRPHGLATMFAAAGQLPTPLRGTVARATASPRMYNLTVSNVPGPSAPVTVLGAQLTDCYPVVPIADGHALAIGALSYCDRLFFGLYGDPGALPDLALVPAAIDRELHALANAGPPRSHGRAHLVPVG